MSEKPCLREPLGRQRNKWVEHCSNLNDSTFRYLLITLKVVALEEVSVSDTQNAKTVF